MLWVPSRYNVVQNILLGEQSEQAKYNTPDCKIQGFGGSNALLLGTDMMLTGVTRNDVLNYYAEVSAKSSTGIELQNLGTVQLQVTRNQHTDLFDQFLTREPQQGSGIDDSFDKDIVIRPNV